MLVTGSPWSQERPGHQGCRSEVVEKPLNAGCRHGVRREFISPLGRPGHDDEGAVKPHDAVHRLVQIVVIEIGAGPSGAKLFDDSSSRRNRTAVEKTRNEEGMGLIQAVGDRDVDDRSFDGKDMRPGNFSGKGRFLIDPEVALGCIDGVVGRHILNRIGNGKVEGLHRGSGESLVFVDPGHLGPHNQGRHAHPCRT